MSKLEKVCENVRDIEIKYRQKLDFPKGVQFGTEIEFQNASFNSVSFALQEKKKLSNWNLKGDPSVTSIYNGIDHGGEVTSPILHDSKKAWSDLKTACLLIKHNFGLNQGKAGSHIHVDSGILNDNDKFILNLIKLWTVYEHVIYLFAYGENDKPRTSLVTYAYPVAPYYNEFLKEYESNKYAYRHILNGKQINKETNLYFLISNCATNLNALGNGLNFGHCNGVNIDDKNTIEFRCPNGTLSHIIWQNNINFFVKLLLYCRSNNFDIDFINKKMKNYEVKKLEQYSDIYLDDAIELSDLIFDNELDKMYFLKQYLKINKYNFEAIKQKALKR